jgi:uncharacterized paraquat-inducible protein A
MIVERILYFLLGMLTSIVILFLIAFAYLFKKGLLQKRPQSGAQMFFPSFKKRSQWLHEIKCKECGKTVKTRYKDLCNTCYMRLLRRKKRMKQS